MYDAPFEKSNALCGFLKTKTLEMVVMELGVGPSCGKQLMIVYVFTNSLARKFSSLLVLPPRANATSLFCNHNNLALH
jgi:hypothetical protein